MRKSLNRRSFLTRAAAAGAAAVGPWVITRPGWSQSGPIKIGITEPLSGPVSYVGEAFVAGTKFAAHKLNLGGGVLGREIEIVPADSELKPDVATKRANDLLFGEKVDILALGGGSSVGKAISQVASQYRKIFISYATEAAELTGEEFFDTTFRCCLNTDMHSGMLAVYFAKTAPNKPTKLYLLNQDYNFGRACADGFKKFFNRVKASNQSIVGEEYHPLQKVQDFGPYITKIMASGAEVVITGDWGQDLRLLLQQGKSLGWKIQTGQYFLNDPVVLQTVKDSAVGHITADAYHITIDTPENKAYLQEWRKYYPNAPISYKYPDFAWTRAVNAILWAGDIIKRASSLDTDKIIKTWEGAKFKAIWGEVEMRACDHQMQTSGCVSEILEPEKIPTDVRYWGNEFPYLGKPSRVAMQDMAVPLKETGNKRCG